MKYKSFKQWIEDKKLPPEQRLPKYKPPKTKQPTNKKTPLGSNKGAVLSKYPS